MTRQVLTGLGLLTAAILSSTVAAVEPTQGMTITGDQELPQVLYIIPWNEQPPAMPAATRMEDPILRPLTPCDTGQPMADYQTKLWNCSLKKRVHRP